jgi:putative endonuclease
MKYHVYILLMGNGQLYTGYTEDLERRLSEHERGNVSSTARRQPVRLIHHEAYALKSDARRREKFLKTTEGKRLLRQQLRDVLAETGAK